MIKKNKKKQPAAALPASSSGRLLAVDILRGITIAGMLLVNNPGSWGHLYRPLAHAEWIGLTPTDLVFPFFVFVMGVSMYFSLRKLISSPRAPCCGKWCAAPSYSSSSDGWCSGLACSCAASIIPISISSTPCLATCASWACSSVWR